MSRIRYYILLLMVACNLFVIQVFANKTREKDIIIRAGISGLYHFNPAFNKVLPNEITLNRFGLGSTLQIGFNTRKSDLTEYRHYLEFNHINYTADVKYLGSFTANKLYISFSPYQYYIKINPEAKNVVAIEAGLTFGFNMYSVYNYDFLEVKQRRVKSAEESTIAGINLGFNLSRIHFNKEVEMGVKCRISPILGVFVVDQNYLATEFFYGIKF